MTRWRYLPMRTRTGKHIDEHAGACNLAWHILIAIRYALASNIQSTTINCTTRRASASRKKLFNKSRVQVPAAINSREPGENMAKLVATSRECVLKSAPWTHKCKKKYLTVPSWKDKSLFVLEASEISIIKF